MNICIVTHDYPNKCNKSAFVFVKMLVDEFSRIGHNCFVISPFNCLHYHYLHNGKEVFDVVGGTEVIAYRPNYLSFSTFHIGKFYPTKLIGKCAFNRAFELMAKDNGKPDVVYCHFWNSAVKALPYARMYNVPLFVASGESNIDVDNIDGHLDELKDYCSGVICVSTKNQDESIAHNLTEKSKCIVSPNAVDNSLFRKKDKIECRERLGIPIDRFVIVFLGWFNERKGANRVSAAIEMIEENDVYSFFIGAGVEEPNCRNILFKGKLSHEVVPIYLNAADAFVLPTLHEGCCNAVVEAMACGLPIISSNLAFNWDVLDEYNSILVNPESIIEIRDAVVKLRDNPELRNKLSEGAIKKAQNLTINERARKILSFIESRK